MESEREPKYGSSSSNAGAANGSTSSPTLYLSCLRVRVCQLAKKYTVTAYNPYRKEEGREHFVHFYYRWSDNNNNYSAFPNFL